MTYYQTDIPLFKIKDGDFYALEWTIAFKINGTANIGYITADGEHGDNSVLCSCEGNVRITFPDDFRDYFYFLPDDSIEEIIEDLVSSIKLQAEIHSASFD